MKLISTLSLTILCLLFSAATNLAFDCRGTGTPAESLKSAAAVFSGKVIAFERRKITDISSFGFGGESVMVRIKVDRWWKGSQSDEVVLRTGIVCFPGFTGRSGEDFTFQKDKVYLVYAYQSKETMYTDGCTRTKDLSLADEDLFALGAGLPKTKM